MGHQRGLKAEALLGAAGKRSCNENVVTVVCFSLLLIKVPESAPPARRPGGGAPESEASDMAPVASGSGVSQVIVATYVRSQVITAGAKGEQVGCRPDRYWLLSGNLRT